MAALIVGRALNRENTICIKKLPFFDVMKLFRLEEKNKIFLSFYLRMNGVSKLFSFSMNLKVRIKLLYWSDIFTSDWNNSQRVKYYTILIFTAPILVLKNTIFGSYVYFVKHDLIFLCKCDQNLCRFWSNYFNYWLIFAYFLILQNLHERVRSDYGLPGWASMVLFGLAIIVVGLLLGIVSVVET